MASKSLNPEKLRAKASALRLDLPAAVAATQERLERERAEVLAAEQADQAETAAKVAALGAAAPDAMLEGRPVDFAAASRLEAALAERSRPRQRQLAALDAALAEHARRTAAAREAAVKAVRDELRTLSADVVQMQADGLRLLQQGLAVERDMQQCAQRAIGAGEGLGVGRWVFSSRATLINDATIAEWFQHARREGHDVSL